MVRCCLKKKEEENFKNLKRKEGKKTEKKIHVWWYMLRTLKK
jgi:hypothetical protein